MNRKNKKKENGTFHRLYQELCQDWTTLKGLSGLQKLQFVWDYYRWRIIVMLFSIIVVCAFAHILWEGQRPCRLRVCVVLNTDADCTRWFDSFAETLQADGMPGLIDINYDQPFDYDNQYYYVQEAEVMTTISSGRMDVAICGPDMYSYLLALNACMPLDQMLSADFCAYLSENDALVYDTANLTQDKYGNVNPADGIEGYYAVDLSNTAFYASYNQTEGTPKPLYAVIIANTEHLTDAETLLRTFFQS